MYYYSTCCTDFLFQTLKYWSYFPKARVEFFRINWYHEITLFSIRAFHTCNFGRCFWSSRNFRCRCDVILVVVIIEDTTSIGSWWLHWSIWKVIWKTKIKKISKYVFFYTEWRIKVDLQFVSWEKLVKWKYALNANQLFWVRISV